jgi:hypothetical protein
MPSPVHTSTLPRCLALAFLAALFTPAFLSAQQTSARNAFWSAVGLDHVAENPATHAAAADNAQSSPHPKISQAHAHVQIDPVLVAKNGYGEKPQLVRVSQEQIGLRYALLLRDSEGHYNEVSPTASFHSGDHIRLSVMANQPGYLYVIQQGSSGSWTSIYPRHAAAGDEPANRIEPGQVYEVPNGKSFFRFDQNPGQEKLFLILSRERIADLDNTINSLKDGGHPTSTPATPDPGASQGEALEAANHIPDDFVQKLSSRDITLEDEETVDQPASGNQTGSQPGSPQSGAAQPGEKAVYVVSKASYSKGESPRVVASVTLHHE